MEPKRRRKRKRSKKAEPIVAANGCRCAACFDCQLALLRHLGKTHRKGGRGPHLWKGIDLVIARSKQIAALYDWTLEEVVEMYMEGRTEDDMRNADRVGRVVPVVPASASQIAAVEKALAKADAPRPRVVVPLLLSPKQICALTGASARTVFRQLARAGFTARGRRPIALFELRERAPAVFEALHAGH